MKKWKIIIPLMLIVLIYSATALYMNDSNYKVYSVFSSGGETQNSSMNVSYLLGQALIADLGYSADIGLLYLWNVSNATVTFQVSVEVIHPNATEKGLQYLFNVTWTVGNTSNYNTTVYLIYTNGTVVQTIANQENLLNTIFNAQAQNKGFYRINVSVVDILTGYIGSDVSTTFKITRDEIMEIAIAIFLIGVTFCLFALAMVSKSKNFQVAFTLLGFLFIVTDLFFAARVTELYSGTTSLVRNLDTMYAVGLYTFIFLLSLASIYLLFKLFNFFKNYKQIKLEKDEEEWFQFKG